MINHSDASNAIEFFESAVRAEENIGSQPIEDHALITEELEQAKAGMSNILHTLSILDRLKEYCALEADAAQAKIEKEGYSYECSHRTDIMLEIINVIEQYDKTPIQAADPDLSSLLNE